MLDFSPTVYSDPKYPLTWNRSLPVDGFYTFSIQVNGSKMFLTAKGKHNLTVEGRILLFIHFERYISFLFLNIFYNRFLYRYHAKEFIAVFK